MSASAPRLQIDVLSAVPALMESPVSHSIVKRAQDKGLVRIGLHDLRTYTLDKHRRIDDIAYGGVAGMVMTPQPIADAIRQMEAEGGAYEERIYLTPDGETLNQDLVNELSLKRRLLLLAGHYKGVDQRIRDRYITREISIGDYVLSGGELPALVLLDALVRLIPGVLNDETSALSDSFQDGLLAPPVYTRPPEFEGLEVPPILRSGHAANILKWNEEQALEKTRLRRPDLYRKFVGEE
jgi:tRNA (guanine37-N1)-methyltransferase